MLYASRFLKERTAWIADAGASYDSRSDHPSLGIPLTTRRVSATDIPADFVITLRRLIAKGAIPADSLTGAVTQRLETTIDVLRGLTAGRDRTLATRAADCPSYRAPVDVVPRKRGSMGIGLRPREIPCRACGEPLGHLIIPPGRNKTQEEAMADTLSGTRGGSLEVYEKALARFRAAGDRHGEATVLGTLGERYDASLDPARAAELFAEAGSIFTEIGDRQAATIAARHRRDALRQVARIELDLADSFWPRLLAWLRLWWLSVL